MVATITCRCDLRRSYLRRYKAVEGTIPQPQQNTVLENSEEADGEGPSSIPNARGSILQSLSHGVTPSEDAVADDAVEQKGLPRSRIDHNDL